MKKNLQNNFTTPEQSKRLLELGVPADSADCTLKKRIEDGGYSVYYTAYLEDFTGPVKADSILPCWSVGRLMEITDICSICDDKAWLGIEYPSTKLVKDKLALPYMEFLIQAIEVAIDVLDFSKLNDE